MQSYCVSYSYVLFMQPYWVSHVIFRLAQVFDNFHFLVVVILTLIIIEIIAFISLV